MLMRPEVLNTFCKSYISRTAQRFISLNRPMSDSKKLTDSAPESTQETSNDFNKIKLQQKSIYPNRRLPPKLLKDFDIPEDEDPIGRVHRALKHEFKTTKSRLMGKVTPVYVDCPDILIIGGGPVGSSVAYHLSELAGHAVQIVVVEKDPPSLSSSLKVGCNGLYQQVDLKPNVEMAQYAADFYRKVGIVFGDPDIPEIGVDFYPRSSLRLASTKGAETLENLSNVYKEAQWRHQLLSPSMLEKRFPWLNVEGVALGCLGMQKEGVCDQLQALAAMRNKATNQKTTFVQGEVIGFEFHDISDNLSPGEMHLPSLSPRYAVVQNTSGELTKYQFGFLVLAAGASLPHLASLMSVGESIVDLPIRALKQSVFEFQCSDGPGIDMPMIMDSNGLKFRKNDLLDTYFAWKDCYGNDDFKNVHPNDIFHEKFVPHIAKRVPSLRNAKMLCCHDGEIDISIWDENMFVGRMPRYNNVLVAGGFGNDEILYAPAAGRGIAELIGEQDFITIDLACFGFERIGHGLQFRGATVD